MKILMIIPNFFPYYSNAGGAERQCLKLSRRLLKIKVDVDVLTYRRKLEWPTYDIINGIKIRRLPYFAPNEMNLPVWLFFLLKNRNNYDIFHVHLFNGVHFVAASWVARFFKKPIIVKIAGSGENFDAIKTKRLRWPLRIWIFQSLILSTKIVAISNSIKKELQELQIPDSQIISIPNGVEIVGPTQDYKKIQQRKNLGIPEDTTVILTVGNLTPNKGIKYLLVAWDQVRKKWPKSLLVSVGGKKLPYFCQEADKDPNSQVKFFLNQDSVLPFLQSADIFILPSIAEGLSNALLEAQACGLPCIASRVGGNSDIISDNINGILIEPRSVEQIKVALEKLMSSKELQTFYGKNAIIKAQLYDIRNIAKEYLLLYDSLRC